jgi:hypothetical protein
MNEAQQKILGTFRHLDGAQCFAPLRSDLSNARQRGQWVVEVLRSVFTGRPWMSGTEWVTEELGFFYPRLSLHKLVQRGQDGLGNTRLPESLMGLPWNALS